ncbi:hypothetical protein TCAL_05753 [Tigriopus californicus]|uniref:Major facilitator superfamily (MFS) profile domain-containing protein n=1 Tax=Tigriopus californicus TaxID=6832 RepID=A0A553NAY9_TIGCA|nr:hypothetical protein TCAL_05753 [Tigriopus californicus]|eukprot:TCALIF_05753-PA protein Name:"Similar to SLC2A3 Solute carrier family 2, facilitated glucose transporter member 3 (Canis familiaris)" AED:0.09 eAED:0.09 QI:77/0/0/1/1/1/2/0/478
MDINGRVWSEVTWNLVFTVIVIGFGSGFQHGYNTGVLNEIQNVTTTWIRNCEEPSSSIWENREVCDYTWMETTFIWAQIVSTFCLGGMMGRKYSLLFNNVFVLGGGALMFFSQWQQSYGMLIGGRFLIGIAAGIAAGITPMYLSEISPRSARGAIGTVYQLAITATILLSQILGLKSVMGTDELWPFLLAVTIIPGCVQLLSLPFCPDSPKHLYLDNDDSTRAKEALQWLRCRDNVSEDLQEYADEKDRETGLDETGQISTSDLLTKRKWRRPLIIAVMLMLAQQMSGINAIIFYSTDVFINAGLTQDTAQYATLGMGLANVLVTILSIAIVERFGRKTLLLAGLSGMLMCTAGLLMCLKLNQNADVDEQPSMVASLSVVMVVGFVAFFAIGPGPIPWFFVSELFTQRARPAANAVAVGVNWAANFLISWSFQPLSAWLGSNVFVMFAVLQVIFIVYIWRFVPETKDRTVLEILALFQ